MARDYKIIDGALIIDEGRTEIKSHEFTNRTYTKIIIPEGVTKIGYWAFGYCSKVEEVVLPKSLEYIAPESFPAVKKLKKVIFTEGCPKLKEVYTNSFDKDSPWFKQQLEENEFWRIKNTLFLHGKGPSSVVVPSDIKIIGELSFNYCNDVESVVIPEGVTTIECAAFRGCKKLLSLELPEILKTIGDEAFANCENLMEIRLPNKLQKLGENVFSNCKNLKKIYIPERLKNLGFNYDFTKKEIVGLTEAMLNGCKIHTKMALLLLDTVWSNEEHINEIAILYLTQSGEKVCDKAALLLWRNFEKAVSALKEISNSYELNDVAQERMTAFMEKCL